MHTGLLVQKVRSIQGIGYIGLRAQGTGLTVWEPETVPRISKALKVWSLGFSVGLVAAWGSRLVSSVSGFGSQTLYDEF